MMMMMMIVKELMDQMIGKEPKVLGDNLPNAAVVTTDPT
jgi:hypothetical protein